MISIQDYRTILDDQVSTDEQICRRLEFLEAFCRNLISRELENYVKSQKNNIKEWFAV